MKILFVRHGKDDDRYRGGWSNLDLTDEGVEQVMELAKHLKKYKEEYNISRIVSSDLQRALTTSKIIAKELNLCITKEEAIRETNNGDLAGMLNEEALLKYPGLFFSSLDMDEAYPNGESPREFYVRIKEWFGRFVDEHKNDKENILVVTHGGVINIIYHLVNKLEWSNKNKPFQVGTASLHILDVNNMIFEQEQKKYYEAYEERYKTAHSLGVSWSSDKCTQIVMSVLEKYEIDKNNQILEIGCGEGRDARVVLEAGFNLIATDISKEAIKYCRRQNPLFVDNFRVVDCLSDIVEDKYDFIYAIAVVHMLVLDEDRSKFYQFIYKHLKQDGIALICTMGDGKIEMQSDIKEAFVLQERNHESGKMMVAGTSCRMVSFSSFENELKENRLEVLEKGITSSMPDFNSLMYVVVKKDEKDGKDNI